MLQSTRLYMIHLTLHGAGVSDCNPTTNGRQYLGYTAITNNGIQCQMWTSQSPRSHTYTNNNMYADGSVSAAHNYCRNPDNSYVGLWCYAMTGSAKWVDCDVPRCDGQCPHSQFSQIARSRSYELSQRKCCRFAFCDSY